MTVALRRATVDDIRFVWQCRQALEAGIGRGATTAETFAGHTAWMTKALSDTNRMFMIATHKDTAQDRLGYVRADPAGQTGPAWMVSLCLSDEMRGRGLARPVLDAGVAAADKAGLVPLLADIYTTNLASRKVFTACGFVPLTSDLPYAAGLRDGFHRFIYTTAEGVRYGH